jgi:hypothetical protein
LSRVIRHLFVCLGAVIVVAMQTHGVLAAQHRLEHATQFPSIAYEADVEHVHDHHHDDHAMDADEPLAADGDEGEAGDGDTPLKHHHHHNGGDVHAALIASTDASNTPVMGSLVLAPTSGLLPPGMKQDAPFDPPRPTRLIA